MLELRFAVEPSALPPFVRGAGAYPILASTACRYHPHGRALLFVVGLAIARKLATRSDSRVNMA
ncbi:hypothetical protein DENSPDRAFT_838424 [Dentipellis sp. KUC8613]|nr:hypothetical protein DENSPDRAFT_838424 [Dentipellis sp. KUC8613]